MKRRPDNKTIEAVRALVRDADVEIIPLKGVRDELSKMAPGTLVTVTCSPKFGLDRTVEYSELCVKEGFRVIPHVAARQVADEAELQYFIERIRGFGVRHLYVIGGDAAEPVGDFSSAGELLEAMSQMDHGFETIGVGCYPEGHPNISDEVLLEALKLKQRYASYMVSQLCFDAGAVVTWLHQMRAAGIDLPLHLGLAAPMHVTKLADLSLKIGVGSSVRYLTKQHGFLQNMLRMGAYRPERLLTQFGDALTSPELRIEQLHLFSFNQIGPTVAWQGRVVGAETDTDTDAVA
ncbi:MAG TPA: methylenetetrahydrofolate reductase [Acidimicrobiales bacterium]|nr:methylenetetrahydrofolate reductase [Acidimicrobiales bacterium]